MAKKEWVACHYNMASTTGKESVHAHFASCMKHYNATDADCVITNEADAYSWQAPIKFHYTLVMKTYIGWKVAQLMTGAFASKPEYEDD
jgi:hypothetical protein